MNTDQQQEEKEMTEEERQKSMQDFLGFISKEHERGNIVFFGVDEVLVANLQEFIKQPTDGILYDLNRDEVTVKTNMRTSEKWVNDLAVAAVIRALKDKIKVLETEKEKE